MALADALTGLACGSAVLDGEVCVQTSAGSTSFTALQDAHAAHADGWLIYYVFDLAYLDDFDPSHTPLIERKRALAALIDPIAGEISPIQFGDHFEGESAAFFAEAARRSLEGVVPIAKAISRLGAWPSRSLRLRRAARHRLDRPD